MNRIVLLIVIILFGCKDDNLSQKSIVLLSGDGIETIQTVIGDTLEVLLYNPEGSISIDYVDFDFYDRLDNDGGRESLFFDTKRNIIPGDTAKFNYLIPDSFSPEMNTRLDVDIFYRKGGHSGLTLNIILEKI